MFTIKVKAQEEELVKSLMKEADYDDHSSGKEIVCDFEQEIAPGVFLGRLDYPRDGDYSINLSAVINAAEELKGMRIRFGYDIDDPQTDEELEEEKEIAKSEIETLILTGVTIPNGFLGVFDDGSADPDEDIKILFDCA
jgi:hypothetical protein